MRPSNNNRQWTWGALLVLSALLLIASLSLAVGSYEIAWSTIDGGGGASAGGTYVLHGVAGQPDAGEMSGGAYDLAGGFGAGGEQAPLYRIVLPLVIRG